MCVTWNRLCVFMCIVKLFDFPIQTNMFIKSNRFVVQDFSLCIDVTVYVAMDNWVVIRMSLQFELLIASLLAVVFVKFGVVWENEAKRIWCVICKVTQILTLLLPGH